MLYAIVIFIIRNNKDLLNIMKRREIPIINEGNMINQIIVINQSDEKIIEKEYKSL